MKIDQLYLNFLMTLLTMTKNEIFLSFQSQAFIDPCMSFLKKIMVLNFLACINTLIYCCNYFQNQ